MSYEMFSGDYYYKNKGALVRIGTLANKTTIMENLQISKSCMLKFKVRSNVRIFFDMQEEKLGFASCSKADNGAIKLSSGNGCSLCRINDFFNIKIAKAYHGTYDSQESENPNIDFEIQLIRKEGE